MLGNEQDNPYSPQATDKNLLFHEEQRFRWFAYAIVIAGTVIPIGLLVHVIIQKSQPGKPLSILEPATILLLLASMAIFLGAKLITQVRSDGLFVRFRPFHLRFKRISLENVVSVESITYSPMSYGGWGLRRVPGGKAYNALGNLGVRLDFTNGKHLLIGSQRADELAEPIRQIWPRKT